MVTLAETLRQVGYVSPQGQVTGPRTQLAQQLRNYATNVIPTAKQNLAQQRADIDAAITMGNQGIQIGDREAFERQMAQVPNLMGLTAYHGTPHTIKGKFDISKVGTGEGSQAYGHGMYFAENPSVAETYKRAGGGLEIKYPKPLEELGINPNVVTHSMDFDNPLNQGLGRIAKGLRTVTLDYPDVPVNKSLVKEHFDEYIRLLDDKYPKEAAQKKALQDLVAKEGYPEIGFGGNLYKVDIPDADIPMMLDWGKPLAQQTPEVQAAIQKLGDRFRPLDDMEAKNVTGERLYRRIENSFGKYYGNQANPDASALLNSVGIKGIRYLDEGSRRQPYSVAISTKKGPYAETEFITKEQAEQYIKEKQAEGFKTELKETGTSNFVVFEPSTVKILEQNSKPVTRKEILEQQINKIE